MRASKASRSPERLIAGAVDRDRCVRPRTRGPASDSVANDPLWLVRTLKATAWAYRALGDAAAQLEQNWGRAREPGEWPLAYVAFAASPIPDIQPWHAQTNATLWRACGFGSKPPYSRVYARFTELERVSEAFLEAAGRLIRHARRHDPRVGQHVHVDSTEAETQSLRAVGGEPRGRSSDDHLRQGLLGGFGLRASGRVRLADGTLLSCANYAGCASKSHFAGHAGYGYCPSKSLYVWGMRLVLVTDAKGVPLGYDLVAPADGEREPLFRLAQAHPGAVLFADKGFWGAEYERTIELIKVELVTPERHRLGERPPAEVAKASIRLVIESVFSNLKRQMRLSEHLAKTLGGLVQRVAQRLLALTLGMFPARAKGKPERTARSGHCGAGGLIRYGPTRQRISPSRSPLATAAPRLVTLSLE